LRRDLGCGRFSAERVEVDVRDDGARAPRPTASGYGLLGMRERARIYGGEIVAGPEPGGGSACGLRCRSCPRHEPVDRHRRDQELVRAGFRKLIEARDELRVVGEAADGGGDDPAAATGRRADGRPHPGTRRHRGHPRARAHGAPSRILILTTFDRDEYVFRALRAGASGFLLKDSPPDQLIAGIHAVARGDALLAPAITRRLVEDFASRPLAVESPALGALTARERAVLELVAAGLSNREIGARMFLAETTVKTHVGAVLAQIGARDRTQAVVFAYESGLVRPGRHPANGS
jgi:DNA-binding NarL/FixJ family response regulator